MQRVTKYPLLLGKILENTPTSASAYPALQAAVRAMVQVNANINEYKRRREVGEWAEGKAQVRSTVTAWGLKAPSQPQQSALGVALIPTKSVQSFLTLHPSCLAELLTPAGSSWHGAGSSGHLSGPDATLGKTGGCRSSMAWGPLSTKPVCLHSWS